MLLELRDGGIEDIQTSEEHFDGCETCDYGSQYINYFNIKLTKYEIEASANQMYEYRFSTGDLLKIIMPNVDKIKQMTEMEFAEFLKDNLSAKRSRFDELISYKLDFKIKPLR